MYYQFLRMQPIYFLLGKLKAQGSLMLYIQMLLRFSANFKKMCKRQYESLYFRDANTPNHENSHRQWEKKTFFFFNHKNSSVCWWTFFPEMCAKQQYKKSSKANVWCDYYLIVSSSSLIYWPMRPQSRLLVYYRLRWRCLVNSQVKNSPRQSQRKVKITTNEGNCSFFNKWHALSPSVNGLFSHNSIDIETSVANIPPQFPQPMWYLGLFHSLISIQVFSCSY